jgi:enoyl-[acyl-carrier protein] reductase I
MIGIDLTGKTAVVTGVADNVGFGWHIAKGLQAAGAKVIVSPHPRITSILERFLTRDKDTESRALPFGQPGEFKPIALVPCDVSLDTMADMSAQQKETKGYDAGDPSIEGMIAGVKALSPSVDIVVHSVAFSPEIQKTHLEVSRGAYLTAMSVSSYSLVAMARAFLPLMEGREGSMIGLTYVAAERVVPYYGGGMATAKAALESDARNLSWYLGEKGHRVNLISAGPYASRAARSIGDIGTMIDHAAERSPLRRPIEADDVAATTLFLASPLARNITGSTIYVDAGYHVMGI